jgi:hypothetical protein
MGSLAPQLQQVTFSTVDLLVALGLGFLLGLWMAFVYRVTHRGLTYERSFLVTLALVPPIVALVMLFIGSNLALSLGMVGALSIIRFRTVIKDSRDMVFLFWAIAVGLGCGTQNWMASLIASGFVGAVLYVIHLVRYGEAQQADFVLVVSGIGDKLDRAVLDAVAGHVGRSTVRSMEVKGGGWEIVMEVRFDGAEAGLPQRLLEAVRSLPDVRQTSLLAPHLSLPV